MNPPQDLMDSVATTDNEVRKLKRFVTFLARRYTEEDGVISFAAPASNRGGDNR